MRTDRKSGKKMPLYKEYDELTLRKLQEIELGILKDFVDLCNKYKIDYFGCGGTAIGAVRHGGFIPWDDDIDIALPRKDYEKFLKVAEKEYGDKYRVINTRKDPRYPLTTTRWMLNGTKFKEDALKDIPCELGIFLDLYCFDNIADDDKEMKKQGYVAWFWGKLLILRSIPRPVLYFGGWKSKLVYACCRAAHIFLKVFGISGRSLYKKAEHAAGRYYRQDTKRMAYFFDPTPFTSVVQKEYIFPTVERDFNGIQVRFPNKLDAYLKPRYGDYMTLPPEDKRHNHPPYELDFGKYGNETKAET